MVALGAIAWVTTPAALRRENDFTWGPMAEVATIFAGIFATMMPALVVRLRCVLNALERCMSGSSCRPEGGSLFPVQSPLLYHPSALPQYLNNRVVVSARQPCRIL